MPRLQGVVDVFGTGGPGFLIPVFSLYPGANTLSLQVIDEDDQVEAFREVDTQGSIGPVPVDIEVDVGGPALWAYRDPDGIVQFSGADALRAEANQMLQLDGFLDHPLAGFELAIFSKSLTEHPQIVARAYEALAAKSDRSARVWRDAEVFAASVRRDLRRAGEAIPPDLLVVADDDAVHILSEHVFEFEGPWTETHALAAIFDIHQVAVEMYRPVRTRPHLQKAEFNLVGVGGVARAILKDRRFHAVPVIAGDGRSLLGARSHGYVPDWNGGAIPRQPLFIAVAQSEGSQIDAVVDEAQGADRHAVKHLLNIRPIGYGPGRADKVRVAWLQETAKPFTLIWVLGNHRDRNLKGHTNNLASSSYIQRIAKALAVSLLSQHGKVPLLQWANGGRRDKPAYALAGTVRCIQGDSETVTLWRVLDAMLSEDAQLHTATHIVVFVPYEREPESTPLELAIGDRTYHLHVLSRQDPGRSREVVGWALDVKLSAGDPHAYQIFCLALLAPYGWKVVDADADFLVLSQGTDRLRVWTVNDRSHLTDLLMRPASNLPEGEVIITNMMVAGDERVEAQQGGWTIVHHAAIQSWMEVAFGKHAFEGPGGSPMVI